MGRSHDVGGTRLTWPHMPDHVTWDGIESMRSHLAHCSRTLAHIRISAHLTRMLTGMWTMLLLSVRMALPHYRRGGADVNGRIPVGAVL